jgi:ubiquitin related modifier 1
MAMLQLPLKETPLKPTRGGLEMLFSDERKHKISIPARDDKGSAVTVGWLVNYLCEEVMKDKRKEMFVLDGHV